MKLDRRDFFGSAAGVTAFTLGLNVFAPEILKRKLIAAPPAPGKKKLVFIFQRGGMDGINAAIPRGDPNYSKKNRPNLFIEPEESIHLDGSDSRYPLEKELQSFVELHPSLEPMMEIYQAGDLAVLHRVGYKGQSQSHFDSQQYWENGTTNQPKLDEGMIYRHVAETLGLPENHLAAIGLSSKQLVALKGPQAIPNFSDVRKFKFRGSRAESGRFVGRAGSDDGPGDKKSSGSGLLGAYDRSDKSRKPYRDAVYKTGLALADVMAKLRRIDPDTYQPENGATDPQQGGSLFFKAKQAAQLLKVTPIQIVGMNIGGWDTHSNQGRTSGGYPDGLRRVAHVFQSFYRDLRDQWDDVLIINMTEFGRTSKENGSKGTDHGESIVMFVAGGAVKGGVFNAPSAEEWNADGGIFSTKNKRYMRHWTDFRAVFAEIFAAHFGDDLETLNKVIPKYDELVKGDPKRFKALGFLQSRVSRVF